jgi:hypothetical protein
MMLTPGGAPLAGPLVANPGMVTIERRVGPVDLATEISRLKTLRDQGVITDAEFNQAKRKLLGMDSETTR